MFPLASAPPPPPPPPPSSTAYGNALLDAFAPPPPPPLPRRHGRRVNDDRPSSAMVMDVDDDEEDDDDWAEPPVRAVSRAEDVAASSGSPRDVRRLPENTHESWIALDGMMEDVDEDDDDDYLSDEEDGEGNVESEDGRARAMVARATSGCKGDHGTRSTARGDHDACHGANGCASCSDGNSSDGDRDAEEDLDEDEDVDEDTTDARTRDGPAPPRPTTTLQHPSQLTAAQSRRGSSGATASQTVATPTPPLTAAAAAAPTPSSHHVPLLPDQDAVAFVGGGSGGGGDVDLVPSYEEMIAQAITALGDPQGHPPREIYAWMAMTYGAYLPVQFKGSATQALKKAWRKSRFLRDNRRYRLNPDYQGARVRGRAKPNAAITPMTDADRLRAAEAVRAAAASGSAADASGGGASADARRRSGKSRSKKKKPAAATHDDHGHDQYGDAHNYAGGRTFTLAHPAMTHHLDQHQQLPIDEGVSLVSRPTSSRGTHTSPDLAATTTTMPGTPGRPPRKRARTAPEPTASTTATTGSGGGGWPIQLTSPPSLALRAGKRAPPPPSIMIPPTHSAAGELSSPTLILERMRLDHAHASSVASPTTSEYTTHLPTPMLPATTTTSPTQHTHFVPAPYSVFAPAPAFHPHSGAAVAHHYAAAGLMSPMSPFMPASTAAAAAAAAGVRPATAPVDPAAVLRDQCINPQALVNPLPLPVSPQDAEFGARLVSAMHAAADAAAAAAAHAATAAAAADPMLVCMSPAATAAGAGMGARPSRRRYMGPDEHVPTLGAVPRDLVVAVPGIEMLGESGNVPAAAHLMPTPAASLESIASPAFCAATHAGTGETMYLDTHTAALVAMAYQQQQQQQVVVAETDLTAAAAASAFLASPPLVPLDATPAGSSMYLGNSAMADATGMPPLDMSLADAHGNATAAGQLVAAWMSTLQYASAAAAPYSTEMQATSAGGNGTYWDASSAAVAAAAAAACAGMAMDVDVVATPGGYLAAAFGDGVEAPTPVLSAAATVRASATAGMPSP